MCSVRIAGRTTTRSSTRDWPTRARQSAATGRLDDDTIEAVVVAVEEELRAAGSEVPSDRVGRAVLERLRNLDHVAYLRFASVYKGFEDLEDFEREVVELQKTTAPKQRS